MVNLSLFFVFLGNTYEKYLHWSRKKGGDTNIEADGLSIS